MLLQQPSEGKTQGGVESLWRQVVTAGCLMEERNGNKQKRDKTMDLKITDFWPNLTDFVDLGGV